MSRSLSLLSPSPHQGPYEEPYMANQCDIFTNIPVSLYLIRDRMKLPYMADQCEQMLKISSEFVRLQVSHDEYLCMKVLLLLSTGESQPLFYFDLSHLSP